MKDLIREVFNNSPENYALLSNETLGIVDCNDEFLRNFRFNDKAICIGKNIFEIIGCLDGLSETEQAKRGLHEFGCFTNLKSSDQHHLFLHNVQRGEVKFVMCRLTLHKEGNPNFQYRQLFEKNVAGVYTIDVNGRIIHCNMSFANILGYQSTNDLIGKNADIFYTNKEHRNRYVEAIKTNPQLVNYEISLQRKDGIVITCLENAFLEKDDNGDELVHGTLIDITRQKNVELVLKDSEERFKTFSEITLESVVFVQQAHIIDCNDQFARLLGFHDRSDIVGRKITEFISAGDIKRINSTISIPGANKTEIHTTTRDGNPLHLDVTGSQLKYQGVPATAMLIYDITARKRAEVAMEQSMVRFRNLLENSPNGVCLITEGKIRYVNQAATHLFGFAYEDEMFEKEFISLVSDPYRSEIERDLEVIREGEEVDYKEITIQDREGKHVEVGIKSTLTVFENKPSIQVTLNNISAKTQLAQEQMRVRLIEEINTVLKREIEDHKETQRKLIAAQNYSRNIIESSIDMIIACDDNDLITEINPAALRQFGYSHDEIVGKPLEILFSGKDEIMKVLNMLVANGVYSGEVLNRKKNKSTFTSLLSASRIRNQEGKVIGSMGVSRDITEYRANERRALEQKAKLESIYNSTENMMLWTLDQDHRITSMNSNFGSWLSAEFEIQADLNKDFLKVIKKFLDPDLHQGQIEGFNNAFKGRPQQFELPLRSKRGRTIWMQVFLNPVYLGDKQEEVSCLVYDISERKEIDRRVRDSLKEKEVLLQEVHHRVKNNLQVISSILNLQSSFVTDPKILEILQESQNRIKSMSFIHETLYRTTDFSSVEFSDYIKALVNNLVQSYRTVSAKLELDFDFQQINLSLDQAIPCGLIVNELVSNSLKYAFTGKSKGKLKMTLKEREGKIELRVSDNGVGLPSDFRYEESESLGIQLVYTLVEQLEGTVRILSGRGTEFLITFEKH